MKEHIGVKYRFRIWNGWFASAVVLSLSSAALASSASEVLSIRLLPEEISLHGSGASQRFVVVGSFRDGLEREITSKSRIQISNRSLVAVDEAGRVKALTDGQADLRVEFSGHTTKAKVRVEDSQWTRPFSFARNIGRILTRQGCNTSSCHGSVIGRGGFKLSMNALNPQQDYYWILKGGVYSVFDVRPKATSSPRINLQQPEKSLLLLKPTSTIPHGGGLKIHADSKEYHTILDWIRNGAPYQEEASEEPKILEVVPREIVLDSGGRRQLLVTAHYEGKRREDLTDRVRYLVSNREVAEISDSGLLTAKKSGETLVTIHAGGKSPIGLRVAVVDKPLLDYPAIKRNNLIDDHIFSRLRQLSIIPSALSGDTEFLRRICLDLTGTLPPPKRVDEFLTSQDPQKRIKLIETLLNSPEYVEYWTFRFADLFRVGRTIQNSPRAAQSYWEWIHERVKSNTPYDQIARERIAAQGYEGAAMHFQPVDEFREPENTMAEQVRVFMGRRLDCAQCHDHPYEAWSQDQFWGMTAFFSQVTRLGDNVEFVIIDYPRGHGDLGKGFTMIHPRTKKEVKPQFLDGILLSETGYGDPRLRLAEWMTSPENAYFSKAAVNRIWSYFFGKGLVNPVDDFRSSNPPTHPTLLRTLAEDFKTHRYDLKRLIRLIVQSRTYQLSQESNDTNRDDNLNYSRSLPRPLDAEVLWDAINQLVGVEEDFERWRGSRASTRTRVTNLITPDLFPAQFLKVFDQPTRLAVPERTGKPNLTQALHMLAGSTYTTKLAKKGGRIDRLLANNASTKEIIEELYLAALSRYPSERERTEVEQWIMRRSSNRKSWEDLVWGLISSREFAYNH